MDLREALAALRASWWLLAVGLVLGAVSALAVSLLQTPLYTSSTQLFVSTRDAGSTADAFQGSQFSRDRVSSYTRLIAGRELADRIVDRLDLTQSPSELSQQISATAVTDTVLIDVDVDDPSPEQAQRIAGAVGEEFADFVAELETPEGSDVSPVKVTVTERPVAPLSPSSPATMQNVLLGALVGLLSGVALALARARLDTTVKSPDQVGELAGAPVIGSLLRDDAVAKHQLVGRSSGSRTAESYRQLRTNLRFLDVDQPPKVIMISSAVAGEGKTTAVVNLGLALADTGHSVTIIDADLRKPKVSQYMGLIDEVGLTNVLAGAAEVGDVIQRYGGSSLSVISSGPIPPNPGAMLASSQMSALIEQLRQANDYVLVDAPPLLPVADASGLAALMDGVLLSVRYGRTTKEELRRTVATLERVGRRALGVILNVVPAQADHVSDYTYGYAAHRKG